MPKGTSSGRKKQPPALSPEAREKQMISLAVDLAEKRLQDGTAAAPIVVHYLKLASIKEQLEMEKLKNENTLLQAKTDAINTAKQNAVMYEEAMEAFRSYRGE